MRQLFIEVHEDRASHVDEILGSYEAMNTWRIDLQEYHEDRETHLVILHTSNGRVNDLLTDLRDIEDTKVTLIPQDVLLFTPPYNETTDEVIDLDRRSPLEVYLDGLRALGSWESYLSYAVAAAVVVWIAFYTSSFVPLIAAVLIAPFGGPAMNVALATTRGDSMLLRGVHQRLRSLHVFGAVLGG
jgi:hypothetical protein